MHIDLNRDIDSLSYSIKTILLKDRTTDKNILDTKTYIPYSSFPELIPRCLRDVDVNKDRTKNKAEVYTPIKIVKKMNALVLEDLDKNNSSFEECVNSTQLEITCGEGVFLVTRYDSETGELIPISDRVGLLDYKLQRLCEERKDKDSFKSYLIRIAKSIYGYEYQGDSLLIARLNILSSFKDFYYFMFKEEVDESLLEDLSDIISWNIFQMDGLTMCIPQREVEKNKKKAYVAINGIPVKVYNWKENKVEEFGSIGDSK